MVPDPSLDSRSQEHECLEAGTEDAITYANLEVEQLRAYPCDKNEKLTEMNLTEKGKEAQSIFINASLSTGLKNHFLINLKNRKMFLYGPMLKCKDSIHNWLCINLIKEEQDSKARLGELQAKDQGTDQVKNSKNCWVLVLSIICNSRPT